jgi:hypothetical protein
LEVFDLEDVEAMALGEVTAKAIYAAFTDTLPPPKVEAKFRVLGWIKIWNRWRPLTNSSLHAPALWTPGRVWSRQRAARLAVRFLIPIYFVFNSPSIFVSYQPSWPWWYLWIWPGRRGMTLEPLSVAAYLAAVRAAVQSPPKHRHGIDFSTLKNFQDINTQDLLSIYVYSLLKICS